MQILNGLLWVAGDPVGRLITTLTLYPLPFFCTFWFKSNHCTSSAENLILKTRKTPCKVETHNIHFSQSQCTEAQCNVIFTLYAISSFTQAFNIALCVVSCFALVLSALLCTLVSHLMAVNHSWALWPVSRPQRGFNLGPAHHQLSLSSSYHFHCNHHHHCLRHHHY